MSDFIEIHVLHAALDGDGRSVTQLLGELLPNELRTLREATRDIATKCLLELRWRGEA